MTTFTEQLEAIRERQKTGQGFIRDLENDRDFLLAWVDRVRPVLDKLMWSTTVHDLRTLIDEARALLDE